MNRIFILSEPIRSGKTTILKKWAASQPQVSGILTPDVDGKRKLYDIKKDIYHDLQLDEGENGVSIGRFVFAEDVFTKAHLIIQEAQSSSPPWFVVDEVGKLEINHQKGFEPFLTSLIEHYKSRNATGNLLLVIRDYLLQDAIEHYSLQHAILLPKEFFILNDGHFHYQHELTGIVLCGGQSVRMGRDKAFITYHKKPQYAHVADQLSPFCNQVYISCNHNQTPHFSKDYQVISDNATYASHGPISGVLSAFKKSSNQGLFVIGCDYPHLSLQDMLTLFKNRNQAYDAVCYANNHNNFDEPLLAIYEQQCSVLLDEYFKKGLLSLRHFLTTVNTKRIHPSNNNNIKSVDV